MMLSTFSHTLPFYVFSLKSVYSFFSVQFCIGYFLLLSCMDYYIYILNIDLLSDMWFINIFPYSISHLLILWMVSFAEQMLFSMMFSHFIFSLVAFAFGVKSKKKKKIAFLCTLTGDFDSFIFKEIINRCDLIIAILLIIFWIFIFPLFHCSSLVLFLYNMIIFLWYYALVPFSLYFLIYISISIYLYLYMYIYIYIFAFW